MRLLKPKIYPDSKTGFRYVKGQTKDKFEQWWEKRMWKLYCKKVIKYAVLPIGVITRFLYKNKDEIVILMYHRVNDTISKELAVTLENFKWQIDYLKRHKYQFLTMDQAARMIQEKVVKGKWIVVSFDDGYEDFLLNAFPVLQQYQIPSMIYLVPGYIETGRVFWWDQDLGESRLLNWNQIKQLQTSNLVTFGSHSLSHYDLDQLEAKQIREELQTSRKILEEKLNQPIEHFSYPRGKCSDVVADLVSRFYRSGVLMYNGKSVINRNCPCHCFQLKRVSIQRSDEKLLFIGKVKGWLFLVEWLRKLWWKLSQYRSIKLQCQKKKIQSGVNS